MASEINHFVTENEDLVTLNNNAGIIREWNHSAFVFDDSVLEVKLHIKIIFAILYSLVFVTCVIGNMLVIIVIAKHRKMRNVTNFFLANLAFSDLSVGIICIIPHLSEYLYQCWHGGRVMCKLYYFVQNVTYTASITTLTVISIERYVAIIHPMLTKRLTSIWLRAVVIVFIWLIAIINGIPLLITYDLIDIDRDDSTLSYCTITVPLNMKLYVTLNLVLWYLTPLLLMTIMYTRVSVVLWKSSVMTGGLPRMAIHKCPDNIGGGRSAKEKLKQMDSDCYTEMSELAPTAGNLTNSSLDIRQPGNLQPKITPETTFMPRQGHGKNKNRPNVNVPLNKNDPISKKRGNGNNSPTKSVICSDTESHFTTTEKSVKANQSSSALQKQQSKSQVKTQKKKKKSKTQNPLSARRKVIRLLLTVIVTFALCVLPHHVRLLWQVWVGHTSVPTSEHIKLIPPISTLFFYFNNSLNPILYAFLSNNFRNSFKEIHRCSRRGSYPYGGSKAISVSS